VIAQIPTAQQLIPAVIQAGAGGNGGAVYEYEPDEEDILAELLSRNISLQIFRGLLENTAFVLRRPGDRLWTTPPVMRAT
jgi:F-type H+-transporting ATPase subunit gamma